MSQIFTFRLHRSPLPSVHPVSVSGETPSAFRAYRCAPCRDNSRKASFFWYCSAMSNAVCPTLFLAFMSSPCRNSFLINNMFPTREAKWRSVFPSSFPCVIGIPSSFSSGGTYIETVSKANIAIQPALPSAEMFPGFREAPR